MEILRYSNWANVAFEDAMTVFCISFPFQFVLITLLGDKISLLQTGKMNMFSY